MQALHQIQGSQPCLALARGKIPDIPDSPSFNHILDLINAIEAARAERTPLVGRVHKFSGWLAQPKEKWPDFTMKMMMDGDINISERLILGKSGFHAELTKIDDSVKPLGS